MDGKARYAAVSIPRRETTGEPPPREQRIIAEVSLSPGAEFAEIEYEASFGSSSPAAPAQRVGTKTADPIRERFFQMRSLASDRPFARMDPGLFYKQAKYMEDFTDDYRGHAPFFMYYPCYQLMGQEQLRTYFTWRAKARRGDIAPVSLSYVFLYIYELLSCVGVVDAADGLSKLMTVWGAFREKERALDRYLPGWIKDFHVYYPLPHTFAVFVDEHDLRGYYPELFLSSAVPDSLELWNAISVYDVTKSGFWRGGNDALMRDCFAAVAEGVKGMCENHGRRVEDFFQEKARQGVPWRPFQQAVFNPWLKQADRVVELSARESYACCENRWKVSRSAPYWGRKALAGYILKKTEACLRQAMKYRHKITAGAEAFHPTLLRLKFLGIPSAELDAAIEKAVLDFHRGLGRTVVAVDLGNLERIRQEALGTQDKLIVPEGDAPVPLLEAREEQADPEEPDDSAPFPDGWAALRDTLDSLEREALALALAGGDMSAFALQNGLMPEVLADRINEKASDTVGDSVLEWAGGAVIYDEYREEVGKMVG